ncbi:MAG TPA: acyl-CoA thioesterase II [Amycolatopsis sp.]|nr:acyl-CoA thioesterase II [Amycolatopsis sp.]
MTELARDAAAGLDTSEGTGGQVVLDHLVALLDLETIDENIFRGVSPPHSTVRVFGGQVAGQALVAAGRTVPVDRKVHSLHAYFIRGGDPQVPIVYEVDRIRDGRSYTTRRVVAVQHGKAIFSLSASFQKVETGIEHADEMPDVPPPDSLPTFDERLNEYPEIAEARNRPRPIDLRYVNDPPWAREGRASLHNRVWMRADGRLPDEDLLHVCVLTYASDMTLLDSTMARHGLHWELDTVTGASLDHALWFHRAFRADEWFLYDTASPSASGGRALATGRFFAQDGTLIATVVQEGMLRVRKAL